MDFMKQINDMAEKGTVLIDEVKDYEEAVVLGGIATMLDDYCKLKGLDVRDTWKKLYDISAVVHDEFND